MTLILLTDEDATFDLTLTSRYDKFNQENMYQTLSELASFCKIHDKNIFVWFFGLQF